MVKQHNPYTHAFRMHIIRLCSLALLALTVQASTVLFCCENHKGLTKGPFCKLFKDDYWVDYDSECDQIYLYSKVKGGSGRSDVEKAYPSSVEPYSSYISQSLITCPNENSKNPRAYVTNSDDEIEIEVRLFALRHRTDTIQRIVL